MVTRHNGHTKMLSSNKGTVMNAFLPHSIESQPCRFRPVTTPLDRFGADGMNNGARTGAGLNAGYSSWQRERPGRPPPIPQAIG